jgi:hypothetical protein
MLLFWQGKGWLVPVIAIGCGILAKFLTDAATGSEAYFWENSWPTGSAIMLSGVLSWFLGLRLENDRPRTLVDPETGEQFALRPRHTVFWIPVKYCGVLLFLLGVAWTFLD